MDKVQKTRGGKTRPRRDGTRTPLDARASTPADTSAFPIVGAGPLRASWRRSANCWSTCSPPALALTALAGNEDRQRALAAGFQAHLAKPVDLNRLVAELSTLHARRAHGQTNRSLTSAGDLREG